MAYSVNERTHEIGIRVALGAPPSRILRLVIKQAILLTSVGMAVGLICAFAMTRVLSALLFGVSATDVFTFVFMPLVLGVVALVASYLPARRAARIDPIVALKCE
jgi:ABC-type antimicrobial peptide transport system permease subunit